METVAMWQMKESAMRFSTALCLFLCGLCVETRAAAGGEPSAPKALVVMIDGMRADTVDNGLATNIAALAGGRWSPGYRGAWTPCAGTLRDGSTESAPNHVAIATGMTTAKSGIAWNIDLIQRGTNTDKLPTWLARLAKERPDLRPLHIFSWYGDLRLSPDYGVPFIFDRDKANARTLVKLLADPDAPDAIMWYIDLPDHAGHASGFYPYSAQYADGVREADGYVGDVLSAIAARPTFGDEDWLIIVTADHGGWERAHGMMSTQCYTVPLVVAGRHVRQGRIPGVPHNYDAAPTALAHFGVDISGIDFDGEARGGEVAPDSAPRALSESLAVYLPFDGDNANGGGAAVSAELRGGAAMIGDGAIGGALRVSSSTDAPGSVLLRGSEALAFEGDAQFAFTAWVRVSGPQEGNPIVFSNKDWRDGSNPGVAFAASQGVDMSRVGHWHYDYKKRGNHRDFMFNCGREGGRREDLGVFKPVHGQWAFYAATRGEDGVARFYQGHPGGYLYCVADDLADIAFETGLPFSIGQDGRGMVPDAFVGDVDDVAIWTRALSHEEIRRVFEDGRRGQSILR